MEILPSVTDALRPQFLQGIKSPDTDTKPVTQLDIIVMTQVNESHVVNKVQGIATPTDTENNEEKESRFPDNVSEADVMISLTMPTLASDDVPSPISISIPINDPIVTSPVSIPIPINDPIVSSPVSIRIPINDPIVTGPVSISIPINDHIVSSPVSISIPINDPIVSNPVSISIPINDHIVTSPVSISIPINDPIVSSPVSISIPINDHIVSSPVSISIPINDHIVSSPVSISIPISDHASVFEYLSDGCGDAGQNKDVDVTDDIHEDDNNEVDCKSNNDISAILIDDADNSIPIPIVPVVVPHQASSWDAIDVPVKLSSVVSQAHILQILQKVKDQSKILSATLSTDPLTSEVCVLIESFSPESASLAKKLIERHFKQGLAIIDAEAENERLEAIVKENQRAREADRLKLLTSKMQSKVINSSPCASTSQSPASQSSTGKKRGRPSKADVAIALGLKLSPAADRVHSISTEIPLPSSVPGNICYWSSLSADADDTCVTSENSTIPISSSASHSSSSNDGEPLTVSAITAAAVGVLDVKRKTVLGLEKRVRTKKPVSSAPTSSSSSSSSSALLTATDVTSSADDSANSNSGNISDYAANKALIIKPTRMKDATKDAKLVSKKKLSLSLPDDPFKLEVSNLIDPDPLTIINLLWTLNFLSFLFHVFSQPR